MVFLTYIESLRLCNTCKTTQMRSAPQDGSLEKKQ
jgi:hypothetical protein